MAIFTFVEGGYANEFKSAFYLELALLPGRLLAVYFNYFVLLPKLLIHRHLTRYIVFTCITILLGALLHRIMMFAFAYEIIFPGWDPGQFWEAFRILRDAMLITSPMVFIIGMTIVTRWITSERMADKLKSEKLEAELGYLRSQINPHFFFNTLNNLYGLALKKSDKTPELIMKLSELMSYILYDADKSEIPLTKELDQIKRYIALENVRFEGRFKVQLDVKGKIKSLSIPPLILLPFVENGFKHGIHQSTDEGWMTIIVDCTEDLLRYEVRNSLGKSESDEKGGLGIENLKRRLDLLFPGRYELDCTKEENQFIATLILDLV